MTRATLTLHLAGPDEAERLEAALAPENEGFLTTRRDGAILVLEARADSPLGLLRTLDDALACLGAAQRAARVGDQRA